MTAVDPVLKLAGIGKRYGATVALQDVSFSLQPGDVCGLLGENGAGKSTLVKILSGVVAAGSGEMTLAGKTYRPHTIVEARQHGVSTAFQELSLVPTLSVATNLFLPAPEKNAVGLVSHRRLEDAAARILEDHDASEISPSIPVADLSLGMRQRVEIIRALRQRPRVLLLDEPTAALSDREWLFRLIDRVVAQGAAILYVSHKLDEIRRLCRRCVILRNGRKVSDAHVAEMSDGEIFSSMAGRSVVETFAAAPSAARRDQPSALKASHLRGDGIDDISFSLAPGEILGVAGLEGQGQSALFKALVGLNRVRGGAIEIAGSPRKVRSPRAARHVGMVLVPEERKTEGIFPDLRTMANISLPVINRISAFNLLNSGRERRVVEPVTPAVDLPVRFLSRSIAALSGGNQQKAVLARALVAGARCLLLFDPTRGVDVGAKQSIYRMMRQFVQDGGAILFYSTELDELVHLCDRCLVLYRQRIAAEIDAKDFSQEYILSVASGHSPAIPALSA
jgi:ribose transport system ATP-binding protein